MFNERNTHSLPVPLLYPGDARTNGKTPGPTLSGLGVKGSDEHGDDEQELTILLGKCDTSL